MRHDASVWRLALEGLEAGTPVALLYVVHSEGSSPGRAGFALSLTGDRVAGSIGGGSMEHRFLGVARQALADWSPGFLQRQVHDADAAEDRSGMICSGEQTFCFVPLEPEDQPTVAALVKAAEAHNPGVLRLGPEGLWFDPQASRPVRHRRKF